nr:hypothetical protein GCM10010200_109820 [Actinomadura rugatobispora]
MNRNDVPDRDRVMGSAKRLFADLGYDQTTSEMIAQAAGVSSSFVSTELGGKRQVYEDVFRKIQTRSREWIEPNPEDGGLPARARFHTFLDRLLDYILEEPDNAAMWRQRRMGDAADLRGIEEIYAKPQFDMILDFSRDAFRADVDLEMMIGTVVWTVDSFFFNGLPHGEGPANPSAATVARFRRHMHALVEPFLAEST